MFGHASTIDIAAFAQKSSGGSMVATIKSMFCHGTQCPIYSKNLFKFFRTKATCLAILDVYGKKIK
jgi:hypothetical protein